MAARIFLAQPLVAATTIALPKAQSRHLQVLRLQPGDALVLFNDEDGLEWPADIVRIDRQMVEVRVGVARAVERELSVRVTLAFGVPANERMDALVEKATELGVSVIQPLVCERSVVRLAGDRAEARRVHWSAVAASASEQCGRVRIPRVGAPIKLAAWLRGLGPVDAATPVDSGHVDDGAGAGPAEARGGRYVLSFDPSATLPSVSFANRVVATPPPCVILSGPEGGLAPAEEASAVAAGFVRVSLGPRVLRADTAPLVLLAWLGLANVAG